MTPTSTCSSGSQSPESGEQAWNLPGNLSSQISLREDAALISAPPLGLIALAFEFNPSFAKLMQNKNHACFLL